MAPSNAWQATLPRPRYLALLRRCHALVLPKAVGGREALVIPLNVLGSQCPEVVVRDLFPASGKPERAPGLAREACQVMREAVRTGFVPDRSQPLQPARHLALLLGEDSALARPFGLHSSTGPSSRASWVLVMNRHPPMPRSTR